MGGRFSVITSLYILIVEPCDYIAIEEEGREEELEWR